ncbi:hypothetical protein BS50DRAFT_615700 [Corynespora cassiicola Philippines]|uniref:C2H2-type domain-containing protein n=1 Tax=Corynespora cassiicola Philippines TaxID=1448308 RepID=A0A2T2PBA0_CORCC|nr:hypothetical protein BS50DRAFT_615700 [Corynespora cassiicola Philippines]
MCTEIIHEYSCKHAIHEKAPCALIVQSTFCVNVRAKCVAHEEPCDSCYGRSDYISNCDFFETNFIEVPPPPFSSVSSDSRYEWHYTREPTTFGALPNVHSPAHDEWHSESPPHHATASTDEMRHVQCCEGEVQLVLQQPQILDTPDSSSTFEPAVSKFWSDDSTYGSTDSTPGENVFQSNSLDFVEFRGGHFFRPLRFEDLEDLKATQLHSTSSTSAKVASDNNYKPEEQSPCTSLASPETYPDHEYTSPESGESVLSHNAYEHSDLDFLDEHKRKVVDRVMDYFFSIFRATFISRSRSLSLLKIDSLSISPASSSEEISQGYSYNDSYEQMLSQSLISRGSAESSSASERSSASNTFSGQVENFSPKSRKHGRTDGEEDQTPDDGDLPPKRWKGKEPVTRGYRNRKFACPYFKRNSEKYISRRSCVGPGWDEVRRVKEHIYRSHSLPIYCPRCYKTFKVEALFHEHQRAKDTCTMRPKENLEGFDKEQEKRLRSRKRCPPEQNEEEKWRDMYRILFPSDDPASMPSPYVDEDWQRNYKRKATPEDEMARYEEFLRRELPPAVRYELECAVEKEFSNLEETLKSQLVDIVRDLQLQLFQSYTRSRNTAPESAPATIQAISSGQNEQINLEQLPLQDVALETIEQSASDMTKLDEAIGNQLAPFEPVPLFEDFFDFIDPMLFHFPDSTGKTELTDSGYDSVVFQNDNHDDQLSFCDRENENGEGPSGLYK